MIAAAEEERFRRVKHWAGFPTEAIRYCLEEAHVGLEDVEHVAVNSDPKANLIGKIGYTLRRRPDLGLILARMRNQKKRHSIEDELAMAFPGASFKGTVHRVEHHLAHLASCFLVSPFNEAVTVSIDGFGDFSSTAWGIGQENKVAIDGRVYFPHSLGIFYQAMTQFLGFFNYGDEYKVMGLAPYGEPRYLAAMRKVVLLNDDGSFRLETKYFRHHKEQIEYEWSGGSPIVGELFSEALTDLLGPPRCKDSSFEQRHHDIARSVQAMYEEAFFHLLRKLYHRYRIDTLTLAGGCAMNSVANGKVRRNSPFKRLYVQSAAGDAGGAIGAAFAVSHQLLEDEAIPTIKVRTTDSDLLGDDTINHTVMDHAYWGPQFDDCAIDSLLKDRAAEVEAEGCKVIALSDQTELCKYTASAVASGQVVGWFQGRMEWGPRALGNRSIICDPRRDNMKDTLNLKIKRRESFRPFAPSVLKEYAADWFEEDGDVPFMMEVYQIRKEKRFLIPAVTHIDGSGRLQTVYKRTNARYWHLIDKFREITGVPMVLNTSFNENEPVVCRPVEALNCFLRTQMDLLVLGNYVIQRQLADVSPRSEQTEVARTDSSVVLV